MVDKVRSGREELRRLALSDELGIIVAASARNVSKKLQLRLLRFHVPQHELKGVGGGVHVLYI